MTTPFNTGPFEDYYELRLYHCNPGRVGDLHHRMGYEAPHLFARHGVTEPLVYWDGFAGIGAPLYGYMLRWKSLDERFKAFGGFYADPEWAAQLNASNVGESMIDRLDLMILRPSEPFRAHWDDRRMLSSSGLHELRIERLSTHNALEAQTRLAEDDLPFLAARGATPLGLFITWFGSRTPQAVSLIEWPDFGVREAALAARYEAERSSERLRAERARYGGPLTLDYDIHLMRPALYPRRKS